MVMMMLLPVLTVVKLQKKRWLTTFFFFHFFPSLIIVPILFELFFLLLSHFVSYTYCPLSAPHEKWEIVAKSAKKKGKVVWQERAHLIRLEDCVMMIVSYLWIGTGCMQSNMYNSLYVLKKGKKTEATTQQHGLHSDKWFLVKKGESSSGTIIRWNFNTLLREENDDECVYSWRSIERSLTNKNKVYNSARFLVASRLYQYFVLSLHLNTVRAAVCCILVTVKAFISSAIKAFHNSLFIARVLLKCLVYETNKDNNKGITIFGEIVPYSQKNNHAFACA